MEISPHLGKPLTQAKNLPHLMRQHPLFFYFVMAIGFSWVYELPLINLLHLPLMPWLIPVPIVGPTLAAFIMTGLVEGKAGIARLLHRYLLRSVGVQWYLIVLIGLPVLILLSFLTYPGAIAAFHAPALTFGITYLFTYIAVFFFGGPFFEEPGWRGFALPRLQRSFGPLVGTLILGVLWGLWHFPLFFIPGYNGAGTGFIGIGIPFVTFVIAVTAMTVIFTWVFNNVRGSLLLMMLLHASINTGALFPTFFPSISPVSLSLMLYAFWVAAALIIIGATRGRLSYKREPHEVDSQILRTVAEQKPGTAGNA